MVGDSCFSNRCSFPKRCTAPKLSLARRSTRSPLKGQNQGHRALNNTLLLKQTKNILLLHPSSHPSTPAHINNTRTHHTHTHKHTHKQNTNTHTKYTHSTHRYSRRTQQRCDRSALSDARPGLHTHTYPCCGCIDEARLEAQGCSVRGPGVWGFG